MTKSIEAPRGPLRRVAYGLLIALPLTAAALPSTALESRAVTLGFAPEEGTSLSKTFRSSSNAVLEDMEVVMNGEEMDVDEVPEISFVSSESIEFEDTYDSVADGRATRLTRSFGELVRNRTETMPGPPDGDLIDVENEETSELTETTIVFGWDEDDEQYSVEFGEDFEDSDEELLEDLWADADMIGFLPAGEVEVGDTWSVSIEAYQRMMQPGGDLVFLDEDGESNSDEIDDEIQESLDGEIECELESIDDGVAVISVTIEVAGEGDIETNPEVEGEMAEHISSVTETRTIEVETELEGELHWSIRGGHMLSLNLVGESSATLTESGVLEFATGDTFEQSSIMSFSSEVELEYSFE